jgi:hypothetical protein
MPRIIDIICKLIVFCKKKPQIILGALAKAEDSREIGQLKKT